MGLCVMPVGAGGYKFIMRSLGKGALKGQPGRRKKESAFMWDRALLKSNAKQVLKHFYWKAVLACLIVGLLTGGLGGGRSTGAATKDIISSNNVDPSYAVDWPAVAPVLAMATGIILIGAVIGLIIGMIYSAFVGGPISVGGKRFFMENRSYPSGLKTIFYAFNCGQYMNVVKTMFLRGLYIFLWSLLLVIPGIIKSYEYYMVPFIMAENPSIPTQRAFELSKQMTSGRKMDLFLFDLSFFGWMLLGSLLFGLGVIFVNPYIEASQMELYYWLRSDALYQGYSDPSELCDIQYPPMM